MEIKDIIKTRRITLGITQAQLAAAVGVSEATVSRWESGDISNMKRSRIAALAKALKISPSVIMGWDEEIEKAEDLGCRVDALKKETAPTVTDERDLEMLSLLSRLTPEQKEMLLLQIKGLLPPQE